MTTPASPATPPAAAVGPATPASTATVLARTAAAEWDRLWSVRSTWAFVAATALAVLGIATLVGLDAASDPSGVTEGASAWDGTRPTFMFALFGTLALAVVAATSDHASGGIVPTLQWTPRRRVLLAARVGTIVTTTTLLGTVLVGIGTIVVRALVPQVVVVDAEGAGALADLALVLACGGALAVGVGLLLRSTAGAMVVVIALVLVLPPLLAQLPYDWSLQVSAHLPGSSALLLFFGEGPVDTLAPGRARTTLALWGLAALAAGGWRLVRSDAG